MNGDRMTINVTRGERGEEIGESGEGTGEERGQGGAGVGGNAIVGAMVNQVASQGEEEEEEEEEGEEEGEEEEAGGDEVDNLDAVQQQGRPPADELDRVVGETVGYYPPGRPLPALPTTIERVREVDGRKAYTISIDGEKIEVFDADVP